MSDVFASKWLKAFSSSAGADVHFYADDLLFADSSSINRSPRKGESLRGFMTYANADAGNCAGIKNFRIGEVVSDEKAAIYRWT